MQKSIYDFFTEQEEPSNFKEEKVEIGMDPVIVERLRGL